MVIRATLAISSESHSDREMADFFRANYRLVCGFLISGCGCPEHEAEDIAQDAFLAVRGRWDHVRDLDRPKAYLFKVAKRRFQRSRQSSVGRYCQGDPDVHLRAVPEPTDAFGETDNRLDMGALVRQLPPGQRQVLWLRLAADFSEAETAEVLSLRPGTVKSQLHDAKVKLEDLVRESDGDDLQREFRRGSAPRMPQERE
jgi:RNA polymerase sigma factor (sigma-70 family)